jgi:hypothetical protein
MKASTELSYEREIRLILESVERSVPDVVVVDASGHAKIRVGGQLGPALRT